MKQIHYSRSLLQNSGQAATEFVIAAVFVLVPLFLLIPLVGKYIDIKHATIQQARYEAWEYTAWFGPHERIMDGISSAKRAKNKPYRTTREEGNTIFFTDITAPDYGKRGHTTAINPLWRDHHNLSLFVEQKRIKARGTQTEEQTPDPSSILGGTNLIDDLLQGISDVTRVFGDLLHIVGVKAKFDAIYPKAYFSSRVNVELRSPGQVLPQLDLAGTGKEDKANSITMHGRAAVLSNCWNAGSRDNANAESSGLVLTSLLKPVTDTLNTIIDDTQKILDYIPLLIVKLPHAPKFGYVRDDIVPYEDLAEIKKGKGQKYFQEPDYYKSSFQLKNYKHSLYYYEPGE
jgi:hypothetical protein